MKDKDLIGFATKNIKKDETITIYLDEHGCRASEDIFFFN